METTLRVLLMLSRLLAWESRSAPADLTAGARLEGALAAALPLILAASGSAGGAAYLRDDEELVLVAQSGMPADLRRLVERLGPEGPSWFVAQRTAESGALTVDRDLLRTEARDLAEALGGAGWEQAAACPLRAGDEVLGVLLIAAPAGQEIAADALTALEIGGSTLALYLASLSRSPAGIEAAISAPLASRRVCSTRETEPGPAAAA